MILIAEKLAGTVALQSPLTEEEFSSLAREDSYTWKRIEEVMNDYRNKLGSNAILEYKVSNVIESMQIKPNIALRLWSGRSC